jgi:hypothetical protein
LRFIKSKKTRLFNHLSHLPEKWPEIAMNVAFLIDSQVKIA